MRLTPSSWASSRVAGSFTPEPSRPWLISRSKCSWICRESGAFPARPVPLSSAILIPSYGSLIPAIIERIKWL